jgi:hypothetical protein
LSLEEALREDEERVAELLKSAGKYLSALKAWKRACGSGHVAGRQKAASTAAELVPTLVGPVEEAAGAWEFDLRAYLEGDEWRRELQEAAAKQGLRTFEEGEDLVCSPVLVQAQPGRGTLLIGKTSHNTLRPSVVASELRRLRDRVSSARSQEFLEGLLAAAQHLNGKASGPIFAKLRDIYDLFCLTPGYKKENPAAAFGQSVFALHLSEVRATKSGRAFQIQSPSSKVKERDVFTILREDGVPVRYYGIQFL